MSSSHLALPFSVGITILTQFSPLPSTTSKNPLQIFLSFIRLLPPRSNQIGSCLPALRAQVVSRLQELQEQQSTDHQTLEQFLSLGYMHN